MATEVLKYKLFSLIICCIDCVETPKKQLLEADLLN